MNLIFTIHISDLNQPEPWNALEFYFADIDDEANTLISLALEHGYEVTITPERQEDC